MVELVFKPKQKLWGKASLTIVKALANLPTLMTLSANPSGPLSHLSFGPRSHSQRQPLSKLLALAYVICLHVGQSPVIPAPHPSWDGPWLWDAGLEL